MGLATARSSSRNPRLRGSVVSEPANGTLSYRILRLEEEVREIKSGQPAVVADRVGRLERELHSFREEFSQDVVGLRRLIIGAAVTLVLSSLGIALTVSLTTGP